MARKRTIHPGAPTDEAVASCSVHARLVWAYLPCHADRLGRLEDKPFSLQLAILPTDQVDMDGLLAELASPKTKSGEPLQPLIERYVGPDGRPYIQIRTFSRHQSPHPREVASVIPPPVRHGPSPAEVDPGHTKVVPGADLGSPRADLGVAQPCLFAASPSDPDPDSDPVTDPVGDLSARADPGEDPRARAIPDVVAESWPEQATEMVRYHHAVTRTRPGVRDPPEARAGKLMALFDRIWREVAEKRGQRSEISWTPSEWDERRAVNFVASVERDRPAMLDVEPTMRARIEQVFDSQLEGDSDPGFVFAGWIQRFTKLRRELHQVRPPPLAGLTERERKNIANTQLVFERLKRQEAKGP
jgi:hypothetical protein